MVNKSRATPTTTFVPRDFTYDAVAPTCVCPAGKTLYRKDQSRIVNGSTSEQFRGTLRDCGACPLRARCLRTPDTTRVRNVAFMRERVVLKLVCLVHKHRETRPPRLRGGVSRRVSNRSHSDDSQTQYPQSR